VVVAVPAGNGLGLAAAVLYQSCVV
jgi:hypothetical protein